MVVLIYIIQHAAWFIFNIIITIIYILIAIVEIRSLSDYVNTGYHIEKVPVYELDIRQNVVPLVRLSRPTQYWEKRLQPGQHALHVIT